MAKPNPFAPILRCLLAASFGSLTPCQHVAADVGYWRSLDCATVNCLAVFLRANGVAPPYGKLSTDVRACGPQASIEQVAELVLQNGLAVDVLRCDLEFLSSCRVPVIVHMDTFDGIVGQAGQLLVVAGIDRESRVVHAVAGVSGQMTAMPLAEFGRMWTGVVMLPSASRLSVRIIYSIMLLGASFLVSAVASSRLIRRACVA